MYLEAGAAPAHSKAAGQVRRDGGRKGIAEVPPRNAPGANRARVEDLVERVLGPSALEEKS